MKGWSSSTKQLILAAMLTLALGAGSFGSGLTTASAASLGPLAAPTPAVTKSAPKKATTSKAAPAAKLGKIALMTSAGGQILLLDPATGKLQKLTDGMDPVFSPDGSKLAFTRWAPDPGVFVRDMKTGEERKVVGAGQPRHPSWSSDGQKLAFVHLAGTTTCLESMLGCLAEAQLRAMFRGQDCLRTQVGTLCISGMPTRTIDQTGISEIGLDGTGWLDIPAAGDAQSVSWRPNSDDLLYRGNFRLQMAGPSRAPYDLAVDTGYGSPAWSPDGTKFVVQKRIHDHTDLALFDASGRLMNYLTKPPAIGRAPHNVAPAWSPDGKTVLFLTDRDGVGAWKLYRMNADGSGQAPFLPKALKDVTFKYDFAAERVASWGK
jgi:dipeptidyl aminopeptidase/acylaminoacyl peptidase